MSIKQTIQQKVFSPSANSDKNSFGKLGIIKESFPESNVCTVKIAGDNNKPVTYENVHVKTSDYATVGWFPEVNDRVSVEVVHGKPRVTGLYDKYDSITSRAVSEVKSDIYTDENTNDTEGGYIF